ncbi:hypothetical protein CPB86DRAFT_803910 [Serendipita vermifera]|nr:hypothetical protein CPB86DRAFT_803910 [Serendipita vermifera]
MSLTAIIGGCASSLCLSFVWPYCFQKQWGIHGFSGLIAPGSPCRCLAPYSEVLRCDCGWIGENDHEFFGTEEEQARAAEEERRRRMAWANHIVAERERERLRQVMETRKPHLVLPKNFPVPRNLNLPRLQRAKQMHDDVALAVSMDATAVEEVEDMDPGKRKSLAMGVDNVNLDDLVGSSKVREPKRGSVLFDGPGGVDDPVRRPSTRRTGSHRSTSRQRESHISDTAPSSVLGGGFIPGVVVGTEETRLNRGVIQPQTVILSPQQQQQRPYTSTQPMQLPDDNEDQEDKREGR